MEDDRVGPVLASDLRHLQLRLPIDQISARYATCAPTRLIGGGERRAPSTILTVSRVTTPAAGNGPSALENFVRMGHSR